MPPEAATSGMSRGHCLGTSFRVSPNLGLRRETNGINLGPYGGPTSRGGVTHTQAMLTRVMLTHVMLTRCRGRQMCSKGGRWGRFLIILNVTFVLAAE